MEDAALRDVISLAARPGLVGPDGSAVASAGLSQEVAAAQEWGVRSVRREGIASGLSPEGLADILRASADGHARQYLTLAEEMEERYLHYGAQLQTRRLAIDAIAPSVEAPDGVPSKIVDAVNRLVEDPNFGDMVASLQDGIGKGYAVSEIMWDMKDGLLYPVDFRWRDPRFFQVDRVDLTTLKLATLENFDGLDLPPFKFVRHVPRSRMGVTIRGGVARCAAWAFMIQSFGLKDWAAFSEVYGMPLRVGKYPASATKDDVRTLLRAVRAIANDAAAVIPAGMEIVFEKVEGSHGSAVFGELIAYCDRSISKIILGQTMTADDGASQSQATVHNEVRLDILRADAKGTERTVNRDVVQVFVAFNFGPQALYPRVAFPVAEPEDITALSNALQIFVPLGLKVSAEEVRGKLGLSEPKEDEELLKPAVPPAPPPGQDAPPDAGAGGKGPQPPKPLTAPKSPEGLSAHVPGCRCGPCFALPARLAADGATLAPDGVDEVDALAAAAMAEFQEVTDPLLGPLLLAASRSSSFEEALAAIGANGPDGTKLLERLAVATAKARGIGAAMD